MKHLFITLLFTLSLDAWANPRLHTETDIEFSSIEQTINVQTTDEALYFTQSYRDTQTKQFMIATQRINLDEKAQTSHSELLIVTAQGMQVFSPAQLVNDMSLKSIDGMQSGQLSAFLELMDQPLVDNITAELNNIHDQMMKNGACSAAQAYAAFTWGQFVSAVIAGDQQAADYWLFENSWAIAEMRIYCEIK